MKVKTVHRPFVPGSMLLFKDRGDCVLAVVLRIVAGRTGDVLFEVLVDRDETVRIERRRVLAVLGERLESTGSRADWIEALAQVRRKMEREAQVLDLEALWAQVRADRPRHLHWKALAEQAGWRDVEQSAAQTSGASVVRHRRAVVFLWALFHDRIRFRSEKNGAFEVRCRDQVEADRREMAREQQVQASRRLFVTQARAALGNTKPDTHRPGDSEYWVALLSDVALERRRSDLHEACTLFDELGLARDPAWYSAFRILTALGVWTVDEELCLRRHGLHRRFAAEVLHAAQVEVDTAVPVLADIGHGSRAMDSEVGDLDGAAILTIDDEDTSEIDDGLGVVATDQGWHVWVVITDPSCFVPHDGPVDREAANRGRTMYLPSGKVLMLPSIVSQEVASLIVGQPRRVLAFWMDFDRDGRVVRQGLHKAQVTVARRLTYDDVDEVLAGGQNDQQVDEVLTEAATVASEGSWQESVRLLSHLAKSLRRPRAVDGQPVRVCRDGAGVALCPFPVDSEARGLVAAFMIAANEAAAAFCVEHDLPALYLQRGRRESVQDVHGRRRSGHRFTTDARQWRDGGGGKPGPYVQVSSPLRRYGDLVMVRQIERFLDQGQTMWSEERLGSQVALLEEKFARAGRCERSSTRYWLYRWLEHRIGQEVDARVERVGGGQIHLRLERTGLDVIIEGSGVRPGKHVHFRLDKVVPRLEEIVGRIV